MNRVEYWIKAKTQYNLHSPFVFDLYNSVLFARAKGRNRYERLITRLKEYYQLEETKREEGCVLLSSRGRESIGDVLVVERPHRSKEQEEKWEQLKGQRGYRVSVDLFDIGLLFSNERLHRQAFLLR